MPTYPNLNCIRIFFAGKYGWPVVPLVTYLSSFLGRELFLLLLLLFPAAFDLFGRGRVWREKKASAKAKEKQEGSLLSIFQQTENPARYALFYNSWNFVHRVWDVFCFVKFKQIFYSYISLQSFKVLQSISLKAVMEFGVGVCTTSMWHFRRQYTSIDTINNFRQWLMLSWTYQFPSDHWSQTTRALVCTWMGDHLGKE